MNSQNSKTFRVALVSSKPNSFGLHGHILVARDGEAWEVARSRGPHLDEWSMMKFVSVLCDEDGIPNWAGANCEIPRRLPNCPPDVTFVIFKDAPV